MPRVSCYLAWHHPRRRDSRTPEYKPCRCRVVACIDVARPAHIIVSSELLTVLDGAQPSLTIDAKVWLHGADGRFSRIECEVGRYSGTHLADAEAQPVTIKDRALLLHLRHHWPTQGCQCSHYRLMQWSFWFAGLTDTSPADRMYDCLPMYHSVGGAVATGAASGCVAAMACVRCLGKVPESFHDP
jgi:hypothetical protein